jgi:hypothetical protein
LPYARLNFYRRHGGSGTALFMSPAAVTPIVGSAGGGSSELAAGFVLALSKSTSLYGEIGKQWAAGGATRVKSRFDAALGMKARW